MSEELIDKLITLAPLLTIVVTVIGIAITIRQSNHLYDRTLKEIQIYEKWKDHADGVEIPLLYKRIKSDIWRIGGGSWGMIKTLAPIGLFIILILCGGYLLLCSEYITGVSLIVLGGSGMCLAILNISKGNTQFQKELSEAFEDWKCGKEN